MFLNVYFHQTTNIYNYTEPKLKIGRKTLVFFLLNYVVCV